MPLPPPTVIPTIPGGRLPPAPDCSHCRSHASSLLADSQVLMKRAEGAHCCMCAHCCTCAHCSMCAHCCICSRMQCSQRLRTNITEKIFLRNLYAMCELVHSVIFINYMRLLFLYVRILPIWVNRRRKKSTVLWIHVSVTHVWCWHTFY